MEYKGTSYFECGKLLAKRQKKFIKDKLEELENAGMTIVFSDEHLKMIKEAIDYDINIIKMGNMIKLVKKKS